jgi:hypothetical protein
MNSMSNPSPNMDLAGLLDRAPYQVGQKLWYVPNRRYSQPEWVTIEKVGRKWLSVGRRLRLDAETLQADGGGYSSPGRAYLTQEEHSTAVRIAAKWSEFTTFVSRRWHPPKHLSEADIDALLSSLKAST